jgi:hypothetical protein
VRFIPDFHEVYKELQLRKDVTLNLLWQEYKESTPTAINIAGFVTITVSGPLGWM